MSKDTDLTKKSEELEPANESEKALVAPTDVPMGFEDEEAGDMIIPRVKVIQTLSPERKDGIAKEGDIIDSLTKAKLNELVFIPVFKFNNNVDWRDRSDGGGIKCIARDGKYGEASDGTHLICASCKRCEFDNTKQGKEALPKCTKYINFLGFFAGERMPIILSFAKTSFSEGKKLYSLAKVTMQNMWNYGYKLNAKLLAKNGNEWYICSPVPAGATVEQDRDFALNLYKMYRGTIQSIKYDMDDTTSEDDSTPTPNTNASEF